MAIGGLSPLFSAQDPASVLRAETLGFHLRNHADRNGDGVVTGLERLGHTQTQAPATLLETLQARREGGGTPTAFRVADPQDRNRDGVVTPLERQAPQRGLASAAQPLPGGRPQGGARSSGGGVVQRWTLNPMDADGDGRVTEAERLAYENAHPPVEPTYGPKGQAPGGRPGLRVDQYA